jgi:hypothetical protein
MADGRDSIAVDGGDDFSRHTRGRRRTEQRVEHESRVGDSVDLIGAIVDERAAQPVERAIAGVIGRDHNVPACRQRLAEQRVVEPHPCASVRQKNHRKAAIGDRQHPPGAGGLERDPGQELVDHPRRFGVDRRVPDVSTELAPPARFVDQVHGVPTDGIGRDFERSSRGEDRHGERS